MNGIKQGQMSKLQSFLENTPKCNKEFEHWETKKIFYRCDGTYKFIRVTGLKISWLSIHCNKCFSSPETETTGISTNPMKKCFYHYFQKGIDYMEMTGKEKQEFRNSCSDFIQEKKNKYIETLMDIKIYNPKVSKGIKKEVYYSYLQTPAWREKRESVLKRDNYKCQACFKNQATQVHHKTYTNLFNEPLFDLVSICRQCHETVKHESGGPQNHVDDYEKMKNIVVSVILHLTQNGSVSINNVVETLEYFEEFQQAHRGWIENMVKETCKFTNGLFFEKSGLIEKKYLDVS